MRDGRTRRRSAFLLAVPWQDRPGIKKAAGRKTPAAFYQEFWCPGPASNRHALRRGILSPLRLPISPPGQAGRGAVQATVAGKAKTAIICGLGKIVRQGAE